MFQERHQGLLTNVQLSGPQKPPYAILRAATGQTLTAIGKGIFRIQHVSVTAYIFRNEDLVHNLLGIASFADCGCEAVFTSKAFNLYHKQTLLLTGKRYSANLWQISLSPPTIAVLSVQELTLEKLATAGEERDECTATRPHYSVDHDTYQAAVSLQPHTFSTNGKARDYAHRTNKNEQAIPMQPDADRISDEPTAPTQRTRLLHEDTRRDSKYVQFFHACLGNPPPTTFLHAVEKGYLAGENQFPRLTSKMIRKHMPNSEATARGHLNKKYIGQPHAASDAVSARRRHFLKDQWQKQTIKKGHSSAKPTPSFDPTQIPKWTMIHVDYTGRLPQRCSAGTLYFLVAC